jgi:hypothetical protein
MNDVELTPSGQERREQILALAIGETKRRRRRRFAIRGGAIAIILLVIGLTLLRVPRAIPRRSDTQITERIPQNIAPPNRSPLSRIVIERIETDPTIASRLSVPRTPPRWQRLDDNHLLDELAAAGKPAGIVTIGGQSTLVFHAVARDRP